MRTRLLSLTAVVVLGSSACGRDGAQGAASSAGTSSPRGPSLLVTARPYEMHAPPHPGPRAPLLVFLHGFGGDHAHLAAAFGAEALADAHGFFLALPDGTVDPQGRRFWNATDACCNMSDLPVDDVAYLDALLDDAIARYPVDPARIYVAGFSNGGFMAHRYACDRAERVAGIVSFAGDPWKDASLCKPSVSVSVLQIHGDADDTVPYGGSAGETKDGVLHKGIPGAKEAASMWGHLDGCGAPAVTVSDSREEVLRFAGCNAASEVQLWTLHGATHRLHVTHDDMEKAWDFLRVHARK